MLLLIAKWYTVFILALNFLLVIAKDGKSVTDYTGKFKLIHLFVHLPIYYFIWEAFVRL